MDDNLLVKLHKTFGSIESSDEWMNRPCLPLNGRKPIDLVATPEGLVEVLSILGRIRHGIFS
ncbi:MbcA/ParS/Xre antitoxin family protein [Mariprofundus ferrooxydans]|uniref:MbcA/ParS/Xre antitoxin family protein n=1 Tax=Mariprofundus ferrooxydans TaxID=314344 RepID=UPI00128D4F06|nr:MbcA/ParS/Xre antitoxin family protein [Mariprofundus ferrooxydans]